jgi:hypothetical protein
MAEILALPFPLDKSISELPPGYAVGDRYTTGQKVYRLVQIHASGAAPKVKSWVFRYASATEYVGTATPAGYLTDRLVIGVCNASSGCAVAYYCFVQTAGEIALTYSDNTGAGAGLAGWIGVAASTASSIGGAALFGASNFSTLSMQLTATKVIILNASEASVVSNFSTYGYENLGQISGVLIIPNP